MLTSKPGLILPLGLTLALGSFRGAQETGGSSSNPQEQAAPQGTLVLKEGTRVQLRLAETLDTKKAPAIEQIRLEVFPEVRVDDLVVLGRGAQAWGRTEMKARASFGRSASIHVTNLRVRAMTGVDVPLRGDATTEGSPGCFEGECFLMFFGLEGHDAILQRGTRVEAYVGKDVSFYVSALKTAMAEAEHNDAISRAARLDQAIVHIYRITDPTFLSALENVTSIYIDGREIVRIPENRFIALTLLAGKHVIDADKRQVELDLKSGEDYYIRISKSSKKYLTLVSSDEGEEEIYPMNPVNEALSEP